MSGLKHRPHVLEKTDTGPAVGGCSGDRQAGRQGCGKGRGVWEGRGEGAPGTHPRDAGWQPGAGDDGPRTRSRPCGQRGLARWAGCWSWSPTPPATRSCQHIQHEGLPSFPSLSAPLPLPLSSFQVMAHSAASLRPARAGRGGGTAQAGPGTVRLSGTQADERSCGLSLGLCACLPCLPALCQPFPGRGPSPTSSHTQRRALSHSDVPPGPCSAPSACGPAAGRLAVLMASSPSDPVAPRGLTFHVPPVPPPTPPQSGGRGVSRQDVSGCGRVRVTGAFCPESRAQPLGPATPSGGPGASRAATWTGHTVNSFSVQGPPPPSPPRPCPSPQAPPYVHCPHLLLPPPGRPRLRPMPPRALAGWGAGWLLPLPPGPEPRPPSPWGPRAAWEEEPGGPCPSGVPAPGAASEFRSHRGLCPGLGHREAWCGRLHPTLTLEPSSLPLSGPCP